MQDYQWVYCVRESKWKHLLGSYVQFFRIKGRFVFPNSFDAINDARIQEEISIPLGHALQMV